MNIQIFNLSMNTEDRDLRRLFSSFGRVSSAEVTRDKLTGRSKRNGIIEMPIEIEARQAIVSLNKTLFDGNLVSVSEYLLKPEW
ncbi:RNA recognition motif domain-containing protein [Niastella populi]|uniref:RNA recognition motif domain-containing protein n=1 Tax=Niastella populi TaxID=550983 RepID=UPI0009BEBBF2|nr:RNA-binding protein [Niastella populi]